MKSHFETADRLASGEPRTHALLPFVRIAAQLWRIQRQWPLSLKAGIALFSMQVFAALCASWLYPGDPFAMIGASFLPPHADPAFPLGTDLMGRDIAAGIVHGARASLTVGIGATAIAIVLGTTSGLAAGYFGGWTDHALMRVSELFQVIPHFLFAIIVVTIMGATLPHIVFAIGITSWPTIARLVRAETLALRDRDFVGICRMMGGSHARVLVAHILPNALPPVTVAASVLTAQAVLLEAGLAFFGMSDNSHISWGGMIGASREALLDAPYMTLIPGAAIVLAVLALSLIGDGLARLMRRGGTA
ncbi:peptide/nickel transport system permease protein [Burkholderia sp. CF099]|nr:peptide/nickel transport system permease protein [Burkholderia sp. CF099]